MPTTATITTMSTMGIIMSDSFTPVPFLRMQSWLSPAFPAGSYSYSHGLEWAVEAGDVHDRQSLVDWLEADLRYGSGRNEAIFFSEAWHCAVGDDRVKLSEIAGLAAVFCGTSEISLESSQAATAWRAILRQVWPDTALNDLSKILCEHHIRPSPAVVLGVGSASLGIPLRVALPAFLQGYAANLVTAGVRLVPLGQTDGQFAIARLEES